MASQDVHEIIQKAMTDQTFRHGLSKNFDATIGTHASKLSATELSGLKQANWGNMFGAGSAADAGTWVHVYKSMPTGMPTEGER